MPAVNQADLQLSQDHESSRHNTDLGDHMQVMESMINCFKLSTEGYNLPVRTVYAIHEAPKGELGLCIMSG